MPRHLVEGGKSWCTLDEESRKTLRLCTLESARALFNRERLQGPGSSLIAQPIGDFEFESYILYVACSTKIFAWLDR